MTKEELIQEHLIKDHFMDILKKDTRPRFIYNAIYLFNCNKFKISIVNLCDRMGVSRSGYYDWIKLKKTENNYNDDWLRIIKNEYYEHKGIYGSERIWGSLKAKNILKVNL